MVYTQKSTLHEVLQSPLGRDMLNTLLLQTGLPAALVQNPLVGAVPLSALKTLSGGKVDEAFLTSFTALLNRDGGILPRPAPGVRPARAWWKEAVVYQVYPRSFADASGDGVGDLAGILAKVPYLADLGVDVLWLSPIYDSPGDDCGYDIRDYQKIDAPFGTLRDFDALLAGVHAHGMKLIMDLVVNHTSDEHAWYREACRGRGDPRHDYYIWADGTPDAPPNNWQSLFGGSAWNWVPSCGQWALHLFSKKQMDLNWECPALRAEVYAMMRWWLARGVDGFRMDVINFISKDGLADGSPLLADVAGMCGVEHYFYGPHLHEYLREMRREALDPYDTFTVGETPALGLEAARLLTAESRRELDTVFNFDHLDNPGKNRYTPYAYDLHELKKYLLRWQCGLGADCWQSLFFDNHDNRRMPGKITSDPALQPAAAKLLAAVQMTLRGTPFVYQGDELGLGNARFDTPDELRDVEAINRYQALTAQGKTSAAAMAVAGYGTRDHARTPMPWNGGKNAGFTAGTPWLQLTEGWQRTNAAAEQADPASVWHFYRAAIALRHAHPALVYGEFQPVFTRSRAFADVFCYFRTLDGERFYVECNLTAKQVRRPAPLCGRLSPVLCSYGAPAAALRPYEANVYRVG